MIRCVQLITLKNTSYNLAMAYFIEKYENNTRKNVLSIENVHQCTKTILTVKYIQSTELRPEVWSIGTTIFLHFLIQKR